MIARRTRSARARIAAVLAVLALAIGVLSSARTASAQSCPTACDLACQSCCSHWKLRGACPGGEMKDEGDFRTFDEAQRSADSRNGCAHGDAECEKRRNVCSGGTVAAVWAVFCDAKDRIAPPTDSEARRVLEAAGAALAASAKSIDEAEAALATFARTRTVRDRGVARAAAAVDAVRASRIRVRELRAEQEGLHVRVTSPAEAKAFSERANVAIKSAADSIAAATAMTTDPTIVDTTAEDRERRMAAYLRARDEEESKRKAAREAEIERQKAAMATAQQEAKRRADELDARRKEAEAARLAAAEASKRRLDEQRANAASSDGDKKRIAAEKHGVVTKSLGEIDAQLTSALASVAASLAVANISRDQRARVQANEQRIKFLQTRAKDVRARADSSLQAGGPDALAAVSRAEVELAALATEARSAAAIAGTPVVAAIPVAAPGSKEPAPVPSCIIDVPAPAGVDGTSVAVDGAKSVPLPAKLRLSSGRHAFVVSQGGRISRQSELVVCGRAPSVAVSAPK